MANSGTAKWQRFDVNILELSPDAQYRLKGLQEKGFSQPHLMELFLENVGSFTLAPHIAEAPTDSQGNLIREIRVGKGSHKLIVTGDGDALYDFVNWMMFSEPKRDVGHCPAKITGFGFEFN
jgi:hypothetical protein